MNDMVNSLHSTQQLPIFSAERIARWPRLHGNRFDFEASSYETIVQRTLPSQDRKKQWAINHECHL